MSDDEMAVARGEAMWMDGIKCGSSTPCRKAAQAGFTAAACQRVGDMCWERKIYSVQYCETQNSRYKCKAEGSQLCYREAWFQLTNPCRCWDADLWNVVQEANHVPCVEKLK